MVDRLRSLAGALLLIALAITPGAAAGCRAPHGAAVTLFGGVDDPDVLVWDSRDRLVQYEQGSADTRMFLLPHALLNRPGTQATVQGCIAGIVHSKFRVDAQDAVGILLRSGRYRGRYGWVSSADLHGRGFESSDRW